MKFLYKKISRDFCITLASISAILIAIRSFYSFNIQIMLAAVLLTCGISLIYIYQNFSVVVDFLSQKKHFFATQIMKFKSPNIPKSIAIVFLTTLFGVFIYLHIPPLLGNSVSQLHFDKYATYAPTARNILKTKNVFSNVNPSYFHFFPEHEITREYSAFPLFEWSTALFLNILPMHVAMRMLPTILGLLILSVTYILLKKQFSHLAALSATAILAISPFFHNLSMITVLDTPALLFFLIGLLDNKKRIYWFGLSNLMKPTFLFITAPFVFFESSIQAKKPRMPLLSALYLTVPYFLNQILILPLPTYSTPVAFVSLVGFFITMYILYVAYNVFEKSYKTISHWFLEWLLLAGGSLILFAKSRDFFELFLPEIEILHWDTFSKIIQDILSLQSWLILLVAVLGFLYVVLYRRSTIMFGLIFSCIFYFFFALKPLYFHTYYKHIFFIMIFFCLSAGVEILSKCLKRNMLQVSMALIAFSSVHFTIVRYDLFMYRHPEKNFKEFSQHIDALAPADSKILRSNTLVKNASLWIDQPIVNFTALSPSDENKFKEKVKNGKTLSQILLEANVGLVVVESEADLLKFSYLLFDEETSPSDRTALINQEGAPILSPEDKQIIYDSFQLVSQKMDHNIYKIVPSE